MEKGTLLSMLGSGAMALLCVPVAAQPPAAASNVDGLDDIVVTARRRDERLQDVPVAVTALTGQSLQNLNIRDNAALSAHVPSLYIGQGGFSSSSSNIALRGITSPVATITLDPEIGIYVDEVYLARNYGTIFDFFDVSGIQVLRGVQGTLFGRNNTGGAVLVSTTKPRDLNEMDVFAGYGNYNDRKGSIVANAALIPGQLAVRLGFQTELRDGYGRNVANGTELADKNVQTARGSILWTPSSRAEFQLTYEYNQHQDSGPIFAPRAPAGRIVRPNLGFYEVAYDTPVENEGHSQYVTGRGSLDLGGVKAKLIANHLSGFDKFVQDVDATDFATATVANISFDRRTRQRQNSVEFQLADNAMGTRIDWVTGLYYIKESAEQPTRNLGLGTTQLLSTDNDSKAAYGHLDFKALERLSLGVGVRYTKDRKGVRYATFNERSGLCVPASAAVRASPSYDLVQCAIALQKRAAYASWDATANYQITPDIMIYARTGRGQKSGGFNSTITNALDLAGYEPEQATDYEVGLKSDLLGRRLRFNTALFRTHFKDIQRTSLALVGTSTAVSVRNAAQAVIEGVELEWDTRMGSGFSLGGNYSLIRPRYKSFTSFDASGSPIDQSNLPFPYVSKHQLALRAAFDEEVAGLGKLHAGVDYSYRSSHATTGVLSRVTRQPSYDLVGARVTLRPETIPNLEVALWGRNLGNRKYITHGADSGSVRFVVPGPPRIYGIELRYHVGDR